MFSAESVGRDYLPVEFVPDKWEAGGRIFTGADELYKTHAGQIPCPGAGLCRLYEGHLPKQVLIR